MSGRPPMRNAWSGADNMARAAQFRSNPNLVIERKKNVNLDGEPEPDRAKEPNGEAETLVGRISLKQMGDRAQRTAPPLEKYASDKKKKDKRNEEEREEAKHRRLEAKRMLSEAKATAKKKRSVLDSHRDDDSGIATYAPQTRETKAAFEALLALTLTHIGDQPRDVVRSVAEDLLNTMKDPAVPANGKSRALAAVLSEATGMTNSADGLPPETFAEISRLCGRITDWEDPKTRKSGKDKFGNEDEAISVVLDGVDVEDDEGGEGDEDENELDDSTGSSSDSSSSSPSNSEDESDEDKMDSDERKPKRHRSGDLEEEDDGADDTEMKDDDSAAQLQARDIDAFWLQRQLHAFESDPAAAQELSERVFAAMDNAGDDDRAAENALLALLGYDKMKFLTMLLKNRRMIVWCVKYAKAETEQGKQEIASKLAASGPEGVALLQQLAPQKVPQASSVNASVDGKSAGEKRAREVSERAQQSRKVIDLEALAFSQGGHLMSNQQCKLPEGSYRTVKKGYEEIHIPKQRAPNVDTTELVSINALPDWVRPLFPPHVKHLNYVQSRIFNTAFNTNENMLLCAPTGSGKTIASMLAMLQEIGKHVDEESGTLDLTAFKIVYIAPMKSLVQEMAGNFSKRFEPLHMTVKELSGDSTLTKQEIAETQVIVTTPEKWDVITRKTGGGGLVGQSVKLVIIDEIHLLHDTRGPVLEAIVARTLRFVEENQQGDDNPVRLVGLSATLPNYEDVATFMRVKKENVFAFDNSCRPVALEQMYVGVAEKKPAKRVQLMNEVCYELVLERAGKCQVLVFVHSRKETAKAARFIRDTAISNDTISRFMRGDAASKEILQSEAANCVSPDLKDLMPYGFGIHHAGLTKEDRRLVEDLFAAGHMQVLVSTSTLAWGVNLPAHTVIIRGTQVYSPERGRWMELSPLDVMQMVGRAGRPQYDTEGEGILITTQGELQYYLSLLNHQLPIESQLISQLPDLLNAEIVLGNVHNIQEGSDWLAYTYLYICMLREPALYGVPVDYSTTDPYLEHYRADLIHSAAVVLDKHNLIKYDRKTGGFQVTDLGRVASYYYVTHDSMATYNDMLKPSMGDVELFRLFSMSHEFHLIPVREEEKLELEKLVERVPIPIKESIEEPSAKVNVLLQAYISRLRLEGFALMSDMVYVTQSAGRIVRALFEIVLKRGWAQLAERCLALCTMVERRLWLSQTPLRQFPGLSEALAHKIESQDHCSFLHLYELTSQELGALFHQPSQGKKLFDLIHAFPKLDVAVSVLPITRALLQVELVLNPDFKFVESILRVGSIGFWILVEDVDSERILHAQYFILKKRLSEEEHVVTFTVPVLDPMPPLYYVKVIADRWLGSVTTVPVSFRHLILPEKFAPPTELHDMQPVILDAATLKREDFAALYAKSGNDESSGPLQLNALQTQAFHVVYGSDTSTLICAPPASGKTLCAELAILRAWDGIQKEFASVSDAERKKKKAPMVYVAPNDVCATRRFREWREKFSSLKMRVTELTGESGPDLRLVDRNDLIIATPTKWDQVSRRWKQRKVLQSIRLFIADDLQMLAYDATGVVLEIICSRMRCISSQPGAKMRIVGLSSSLANARDVAEWLGATPQTLFNFHPSVRPLPLELHIQGFDNAEHSARIVAMQKPLVQAVRRYGFSEAVKEGKTTVVGEPLIVFVPTRHDANTVARELVTVSFSSPDMSFLKIPREQLAAFVNDVRSPLLRRLLESGIGMVWEGMTQPERLCVERLFVAGAIQVVIATHDQVWAIDGLPAHAVIIMGTESYNGAEHRYVEYPIPELLQMTGRACLPSSKSASSTCVLLCNAARKDIYRRFLFEPLPVESRLPQYFHDHLNAEIVLETIENEQDAVDYLTWTLLYRRLTRNPNYYELAGATPNHISDYLSELVESTLADLERAKCIAIEDTDVSALNLGIIAAHYNVSYATIELFSTALTNKTRVRGLLEVLAAATEFDSVPVRHHEESALRRAAQHLPCPIPAITRDGDKANLKDPHVKTHILLQAHLTRTALPPELQCDQRAVIERTPNLLKALVDVIGNSGWLAPALAAMELSQLITQALWQTDSALKQLPYFTDDIVNRCTENKVESIYEILDVEDKVRLAIFEGLSARQIREIAGVCNDYPNIDMQFSLSVEDGSVVQAGDSVSVNVVLTHASDEDEEDEDGNNKPSSEPFEVVPVHAPFFPQEKFGEWWLVVGEQKANSLVSIQRLALNKRTQNVQLEFVAPAEEGKHEFTVMLMSDSYIGCDQEYHFSLSTSATSNTAEMN